MDDELRLRYEALVDWVEPQDPFVALVKPLVESAAARNRVNLRPDAKYFLLLNLTEMIMRPYSAEILTPPVWWATREEGRRVLRQYRDFTPQATIVRIEQALDIIMSELPRRAEPDGVSAHQVLLAIDRKWRQLSDFFAWG